MHPLFEKHRSVLDGALEAMRTRGFWSAYPEQPSPKVYGETANDEGKAAALGHAGRQFELDQPGRIGWLASDGGDPYPIVDDPAQRSVLPPALDLPNPEARGDYEVDAVTYGSGTDLRRREFGEEVDWTSRSLDATKLLPEWKGFRARAR